MHNVMSHGSVINGLMSPILC